MIVGLGNPGREYADTRHNVGFMVASLLVERWAIEPFKDRFRGRVAEGRIELAGAGDRSARRLRVVVLCPQTFMNDAGRSVGPARGALRLELRRIVVVHDEIDLSFGEVRVRLGGGLAGHNGLKSIRRELGAGDFVRVRVGVGRPDSSDPSIVSRYVLGRFREPREQLEDLIERAAAAVERVLLGDPPL